MDGVRGLGRAIFAAVLLMIGGVLNIIWGIAAISNSKFFSGHHEFVFSNLKTWGWITLIVGILEICASVSLFAGGTFGRWFAILVGSLAAIDALLNIGGYPFWSIAVFALSLWIIYGLLVYGEEAEALGSVSQGPARTAGPPPPM